jgi:2-dehydro-3-deoxy-D-arabinonate dehydratase
MKIYKTSQAAIVEHEGKFYSCSTPWDELINKENLYSFLSEAIMKLPKIEKLPEKDIQAPVGNQEVWASGVTYFRSKEARMDESKKSGASVFYDKVYDAERPELFFKSSPARVVASGGVVNIRRDSTWNVPEPELTLFINSKGKIAGYTIGNDMSSRSIEGENPLYLPQAKTYERSASLGPCLLVTEKPISPDTTISMDIARGGKNMYSDKVQISMMKRKHDELASFLFREMDFASGCFLMTGTCLVPNADFTLAAGDDVTISIDGIGTLINKIGIRS